MRKALIVALAILCAGIVVAGCDGGSNPLAPYEGQRPLTFLKVTQSFAPEIQWVGGRVAAAGVNRGTKAGLDSTLVWLMTAEDNQISSHVTVGRETNEALVQQFGGTPLDTLVDGHTYTVWLAEKDPFEAELDSSAFDGFNFVDTTLTLDLSLNGRSLGGVGVDISISREETLAGTRYIVQWTPDDVPFRQIAITQGRVGSFTNLAWHVVLPDSVEDSILPPVVIGEVPSGADEVVDWAGFESATYIYWMTNSGWDGSFSPRAEGYAFFQVFDTNFERGSGEEEEE